LETPIDEPGDDRRNVAALWELAGLKEKAPEAEKGFSMLTAALQKRISAQARTPKRKKLNAEKQSAQRKKAVKAKKSGARKSRTKKKRG
jgi:hypothetical protein